MDARERGIADRGRLVVTGISALYMGAQDPTIREFVQKARKTLAEDFSEAGEEGISVAALEDFMLNLVGYDPRRRRETHIRALSHAKGVLVGQKKSPERDERLRVVSERLSKLDLTPII